MPGSLDRGVVTGAIVSYLINRFIFTPFQRRQLPPITIVIVASALTCADFRPPGDSRRQLLSYKQSFGPRMAFPRHVLKHAATDHYRHRRGRARAHSLAP